MTAAGAYARLLLEQAPSGAAMDQVRTLAADPALRAAMEDPAYETAEKEAAADRLFPEETRPFFRLLCRNGDWVLLPEILAEYDDLARRRDRVAKVTFTCRHAPTRAQRDRVQELVRRRTGCQTVAWRTVLDPAVLGGFILTVDDWVLDRSLRTMAEELGRQIKGGGSAR